MTVILELSPSLTDALHPDVPIVQGVWNASAEAAGLAEERGHTYLRPEPGEVDAEQLDALLARAEALVLAPTVLTPTGMWLPLDGEEAGRAIGHRLLDRLSNERPDLHVVLVSHFLVGHGVAHRNSRTATWSLRALEAHARGGRNPWTILRPTWMATVHDPDYQTRLTQDPHADGLVTTAAVAATVLTAVEHPEASAGRTAAVFNLSIPEGGRTDLVAELADLAPDLEAELTAATSAPDRTTAGAGLAVAG